MKVLFLTIDRLGNLASQGLYADILRTFQQHGHQVFAVSPYEKREGKETEYTCEEKIHVLRVKIGNITKCGRIEKGISTLLIERQYLKAIRKHFAGARFDLVMYSTPPITLVGVVDHIKRRDHAQTYLLLKDIFPQNAVDLGMMKKSGLKGLLYRFFRAKEKRLYSVSDRIGCMSPANVDYVLKHNPEIDPATVCVCPNCIEPRDLSLTPEGRREMREKYNIPQDKKIFVYGGNLGKPQGITFLTECLKNQKNNHDAFFLIVGDGTEYSRLESFVKTAAQNNIKLMKRLPKEDYDRMIAACDVGMIFLDHRFTIPNFPSRLLAYMQARLPVLAATDPNTDVGKVITEGGFGWWCESNDTVAFDQAVSLALSSDLVTMGGRGYAYLEEHYTAEQAYETIMK